MTTLDDKITRRARVTAILAALAWVFALVAYLGTGNGWYVVMLHVDVAILAFVTGFAVARGRW